MLLIQLMLLLKMGVLLPFYSIVTYTYVCTHRHVCTCAWAHICMHKEGNKNCVHEHVNSCLFVKLQLLWKLCNQLSIWMKRYMLKNTEDVHGSLYCMRPLCLKAAVPPRLDMTGFREVQRQIENYAHTFNFTPQQNKLKVVSLKHSLSVVSQVL